MTIGPGVTRWRVASAPPGRLAGPVNVTIAAESPDSPDAVALIDELQAHLGTLYPVKSQHGFTVRQLIEQRVAFFVLRADGRPAGCGGILLVGREYGELKRMFVRPEFRGQKFGDRLVERLSQHAREHGVTLLRLETGIHQLAAIRLYERLGFRPIPAFPPYAEDPVSRCYEMKLA